jgi:two-component system osmolarity sensor histidine kinase EnvZ
MGRALLIVIAPLIIMQVLSAYVFYEKLWDQVVKRLALGVAGDVAMLVDALAVLPRPEDRAWILQEAGRNLDLITSFEPGTILPPPALRGEADFEGEMRRALMNKNLMKPLRVDTRSEPDQIKLAIQLPEGVLRVTAPRSRLVSWSAYVFVLWQVGTSLILLGIATIFMRNQVSPVRRLARAADAFGKGRDTPDFRVEGAREVRLAARAFIAMRNRIQRQITQRTAMLAGVSHDLRTPLTRMKLQLEMMPNNDETRELRRDIAEMKRMLEGYLAFARGEGTEKPTPCDLGNILVDAVRKAGRHNVSIGIDVADGLTLPLRQDAFRRCVVNLLENAARFATMIAVSARKIGSSIEVTIDDNGPGIPLDKREEVFKPFSRLESSRNPRTGGVGLGLTIARDVMHSHGGEIALADSPQGGLRVRLRLPG